MMLYISHTSCGISCEDTYTTYDHTYMLVILSKKQSFKRLWIHLDLNLIIARKHSLLQKDPHSQRSGPLASLCHISDMHTHTNIHFCCSFYHIPICRVSSGTLVRHFHNLPHLQPTAECAWPTALVHKVFVFRESRI